MPSSLPAEMVDPALLDLFRAEVETHAQALNQGLLELEKDPTQVKLIEPLMRAAHSIKGAARIVGLPVAVSVAHALEDCLVAAQNGQLILPPAAIDVLLRGVDVLSQIGQQLEQFQPEAAGVENLLGAIAAIRAGEVPGPVSAPVAPAAAPSQPVRVEDGQATIVPQGTLDAAQAERIRQALVQQPLTACLVDLHNATVIEPAGLGLLAILGRQANFTLAIQPGTHHELLEWTGLGGFCAQS